MGLFSKSKKTEKPTRPDKPAELAGNPLPVASPIVPTTTTSPQTDFRPVFLLIWPSATFKAHWAIFIPDADDRTYKRGRYIHVEGSLKEGFRFEIVRGWDISKSRRRPHSPIEIGCIPAGLVTDSATDDKLIKESIARDQIEEFFASIPPPSASLNSGSSAVRFVPSLSGLNMEADASDIGARQEGGVVRLSVVGYQMRRSTCRAGHASGTTKRDEQRKRPSGDSCFGTSSLSVVDEEPLLL